MRLFLPVDADLVEQDMARVAQELVVVHGVAGVKKAGLARPLG